MVFVVDRDVLETSFKGLDIHVGGIENILQPNESVTPMYMCVAKSSIRTTSPCVECRPVELKMIDGSCA